jgi:hypothetical protein
MSVFENFIEGLPGFIFSTVLLKNPRNRRSGSCCPFLAFVIKIEYINKEFLVYVAFIYCFIK